MAAYSYPILNVEEITQCMGELNMPMSMEELAHPNREQVRNVFIRFVELLMGVSIDDFQQPAFSVMEMLQYPELHEESIPELSFFRSLRQLMRVCGVEDFQMTDLTRPSPSRLRNHLSAVINFAKFREERLSRYQEVAEASDRILEQRNSEEQKNSDLQRRLQSLSVQAETVRPEAERLEAANQALIEEISTLNRKQADMQTELRGVKEKFKEGTDSIANHKFQILSLRQEISRLETQVIASPEEMKKELANLSKQVEGEKESMAANERRARELYARLQGLTKVEEDVQACLKHLSDCLEEKNKLNEKLKSCEALQQKASEMTTRAKELENTRQHLDRQLKSSLERTARFEQQKENRLAESISALKKSRTVLSALKAQRGEEQIQIDAVNSETDRLVAKMAELKHTHEEEIKDLQNSMNSLVARISAYHKALGAELGVVDN
eukprot:GCRY01004444.1.p1 GENE.GCRY01004444.1~~GCRY01004444.1.p1  ORF type:complete len:484 (+),score=136.12 GCRY01004444.1:131-1453(+)